MLERVQKFISEAGVASRRKAEEFIKSGQVSINGRKAKLGDKVDPSKDEVKVYGKLVQPVTEKLYIAINKPRNTVVSKRDPQGRKTIFSFLPEDIRTKVHNIGRLDFETEGLLILTNDGDLTEQLAHPRYEHEKEYEVIPDTEPKPVQLERLKNGVDLPTGLTREAKVKVRSGKIYITIHEGKKRQVRRMFNSVGLGVHNLKRVRINKYTMPPDLAPGEFISIQKSDIL
ncbi:rRNA pseudouridine synthase [bacterium]|nr:MAG: rRNA pseudouridine synthase [bacterium]